MILKIVEKTERVIITVLLFSLLLVIIYTTFVFLGLLFSGIISGIENSFSEHHILTQLHKVFGGFLSVLIGIELLHTIKMYLKEDVVHVEVVLLVALIGVARHIIDFDMEHTEPFKIFGVSTIVVALAASYFLIKNGMKFKRNAKKLGEEHV